jgi:ribosomal protein S27AE
VNELAKMLAQFHRDSGLPPLPANPRMIVRGKECPRCGRMVAYYAEDGVKLLCTGCDLELWEERPKVKGRPRNTRRVPPPARLRVELETLIAASSEEGDRRQRADAVGKLANRYSVTPDAINKHLRNKTTT